MIVPVERLRVSLSGPLSDRDAAPRVRLEVARPVRVRRARRHEERAVRPLAETHGDGDGASGGPTARLDEGDRPPAREFAADGIVRQRPRCQDLPSVATAGA